MPLFFPFPLTYSGLQEEMELKPRQVCLFAWTDPTKPRILTWGYSQHFGEHDLLKVNFVRREVNVEPIQDYSKTVWEKASSVTLHLSHPVGDL